MADLQWEALTVWDNIDAGVRHLGLTQPGIVWGLANLRWQTVDERDAFLRAISQKKDVK